MTNATRVFSKEPLLSISLLALLLLPLSLSCDTKRAPTEVRAHYMGIVQTLMDNTRGSITTLLQNSSCPELVHMPPSCTSDSTTIVNTLRILTCRMKNLRLSHTDRLTTSVLTSIRCPCPEKPTRDPNVTLKRKSKRTVTSQKRNTPNKNRRETRKVCKAKAILSTMTQCYEILNILLKDQ